MKNILMGALFLLGAEIASGTEFARKYEKKENWQETLTAYLNAPRLKGSSSFKKVSTEVLRNGAEAQKISASVTGEKYLVLVATDGGDGDGDDHSVWVNAKLTDKTGNVTWLDSIKPVASKADWGKVSKASDDTKNPVVIGGEKFPRYIWAHASSYIVYKLDGKFDTFEAQVGIDQRSSKNKGSAAFIVDNDPLQYKAVDARLWSVLMQEFPAQQGAIIAAKEWLREDDLPIESSKDIFKKSSESQLQVAQLTLDFVKEAGADTSRFEKQLSALQKSMASEEGSLKRYLMCRKLRRSILLSHPKLDFDKLLFNKRQPPMKAHNAEQYLGAVSRISPGLVVLVNWKSTSAKARYITRDKFPAGSILHPDLSFDAKKVIFSFCDHSDKTISQKEKRFFIWEGSVDGSEFSQITGTKNDPMEREEGRYTMLIEDYDPCYLPDGGIVFTSSRSQNQARCHARRYVPAFYLYRMNGDGSGIRPFSYGEANEIDPAVLNDGRVIFNRWEYINRHDQNFHGLWSAKPDGTGTANYWGNLTPAPKSVTEAKAIPGSHKVMGTATAHHSYTAGSIVLIDPRKGDEGEEPLTRLTPEVGYPEGGASIWQPTTYATPYPITEDLFFAAYSPYKHVSQGAYGRGETKDNTYGVYLVYHINGKAYREQIYRDPAISCFTPIPIKPRKKPPVIPSMLPEDRSIATGTYVIQNVYESTQKIEKGSVKYIRVNVIINQPSPQVEHRGWVMQEAAKRIVGTVPVNPDGSVSFTAPAKKPLQLQLLDKNKMCVMNMRTFIFLHPGETVSCIGCHESRTNPPSVKPRRSPLKIHPITPFAGQQYDGGFSYVRSVQPVLDRYCISCHGLGDKPKGKVNLLGSYKKKAVGRYPKFPKNLTTTESYDYFTSNKKYYKILDRNKEPAFSTPKDFLSHTSQLPALLMKEHNGVKVDRESFERIVSWLDLNAQLYGDYSFVRNEYRKPTKDGEAALRKYIAAQFGKKIAAQPYAALVNNGMITESRILKAPLAVAAGGWGQIKNGWESTNDPGYIKMKKLVEQSLTTLPEISPENPSCDRSINWVKPAEEKYRKKLKQ